MVSNASSSAFTSPGDKATSAAPAFSFMRVSFRVPGMGTIHGRLQSIQAKLIWAGVACFSAAISFSSFKRAAF